ncbi:MAG TPA: family 1 encapsulin nanocompartment shell protein [Armatimonadota bacterium]|nr:family 1 encapsulin nanocompartment shell protein [Armatimonadota bacterium]
MVPENLLREDAPLTAEEWTRIDETVVQVARNRLVARRFISLYGPLGAGVQCVHEDTFAGADAGAVSLLGEEDVHPVHAEVRDFMAVPLIFKDFQIHWRDIETSRSLGMPLETSAAAAAANFVAHSEDDMILNGNEKLGFEGLMNARWRNTVPLLNWDEAGRAFQNTVDATRKLLDSGFYGPFAMVVSPNMFAKMQRVYNNTGVLEISRVRELVTAGVLQTPALPDNGVLLVATGQENLDIAIAQDLITAYLGPENMNHPFRVLEALVLRIKRPEAICTLEPQGEGKAKSKSS